MPDLSIQNIDQIRNDISRQEISFSHLLDELIDHVCCDVENEMLNGLEFSEAYEKVRKKIGPEQFREIQKETLYAVDFKYRNMRNTMKISGIAGTILLGFAALFKIQHWPGAGIMMTLGAFILALVFLPSALSVLWKETHNKRRLFLFVSAFITGAFFITGTLFKVQHWPGAATVLLISAFSALFMFFPAVITMIYNNEENKKHRYVAVTGAAGAIMYILGMSFKIQHWPLASILILLGILILGFIALPWYTYLTWKDEKYIDTKFIFLIVASLAIVVPGALVNLNLQYGYQEGYYINIERQDSFTRYLIDSNSKLVRNINDTSAIEKAAIIHTGTLTLLNLIDQIQTKMVQESEGQPGKPALSDNILVNTETGLKIDYKHIGNPFDSYAFKDHLLPGTASRNELDQKIQEYRIALSELLPEYYGKLLDPSMILPSGNVNLISLMSGLNALGLLKSSILTCENAVLRTLQTDINQVSATK